MIRQALRIVAASQTADTSENRIMTGLLDSQRSIPVRRRMAAEMRMERTKQAAGLKGVCGSLPE
jgi:hypothetical protein